MSFFNFFKKNKNDLEKRIPPTFPPNINNKKPVGDIKINEKDSNESDNEGISYSDKNNYEESKKDDDKESMDKKTRFGLG